LGSLKIPPLYRILPLRAVRNPLDCPDSGLADLVERVFPNLINGPSWIKSTEWGHTFTPSCSVKSTDDFPGCSDSKSERLGCDNESESVSDI